MRLGAYLCEGGLKLVAVYGHVRVLGKGRKGVERDGGQRLDESCRGREEQERGPNVNMMIVKAGRGISKANRGKREQGRGVDPRESRRKCVDGEGTVFYSTSEV